MPATARALASRVPADHAGPRPNSDPIDGFRLTAARSSTSRSTAR